MIVMTADVAIAVEMVVMMLEMEVMIEHFDDLRRGRPTSTGTNAFWITSQLRHLNSLTRDERVQPEVHVTDLSCRSPVRAPFRGRTRLSFRRLVLFV
jgi:capsule polysaccharide modification protein KpsS